MPSYASGSNTFVPSNEATGNQIVGFSRKPDKFKINQYAQIVPVTQSLGLYRKWTSQIGALVSPEKFIWKDGAVAPTGVDNQESWTEAAYITKRYAPTVQLGNKSLKQADWPLLAAHTSSIAQQTMTLRTLLAHKELATAPWGTHGLTVDDGGSSGTALYPAGQNWGTGTSTNPVIFDSLSRAALLIQIDTMSAVDTTDLVIIINPDDARIMAKSPEIRDYIKSSQYALPQLVGGVAGQNANYGLPDQLYGWKLVVEESVLDVGTPGFPQRQWLLPTGRAYMLSRIGGLEGVEGSINFSTLQGFFFEEMTVESREDTDNRLTWARIVTDFCYQVVAPVSGVKFERCFG